MNKTISDITELITTYYPRLRKVFRNLVSIKDIPISMTQLTCLSVVNKQTQLTMSDLADELSMSNQQLTKVVDVLCGFEMVERVSFPDNRRKIYARITEKGKETMSNLNEEINRKLSRVMQKFSPDETDKLYECLAHVASYVGYKE